MESLHKTKKRCTPQRAAIIKHTQHTTRCEKVNHYTVSLLQTQSLTHYLQKSPAAFFLVQRRDAPAVPARWRPLGLVVGWAVCSADSSTLRPCRSAAGWGSARLSSRAGKGGRQTRCNTRNSPVSWTTSRRALMPAKRSTPRRFMVSRWGVRGAQQVTSLSEGRRPPCLSLDRPPLKKHTLKQSSTWRA